MYAVGFFVPIALVPQVIQIYSTKDSAGVSLMTWILLSVANALWAVYATVHKDTQLIIASSLVTIFDIIIVVGVLLYQ